MFGLIGAEECFGALNSAPSISNKHSILIEIGIETATKGELAN